MVRKYEIDEAEVQLLATVDKILDITDWGGCYGRDTDFFELWAKIQQVGIACDEVFLVSKSLSKTFVNDRN